MEVKLNNDKSNVLLGGKMKVEIEEIDIEIY